MGMTLRDPSQADFNQLKKMLVDGTISPQQLQGADVSYTGPPERIDQSSQNMLAQMMQGKDSPQSQNAQPKQVWDQAAADQAFQMNAKQTSQQIYNDNPNNLLGMLKSQTPVGPTPRDPGEPDALDKILPAFLKATNYSPQEQQDRLNLARNADREADLALRIGQSQDPMAQSALIQASASQGQNPAVRQGANTVQMDGGPRQSIGAQNGPSPQQLSDQASISQNANGVPLSQLTAGGGYQNLNRGQGLIRMTQPDGSTEDRYINDSPTQAGQSGQQAFQIPSRLQGPSAPMKLYGYGDGTLSSLGNASPDSSAATDISRNPVNVPGLGTGYYSKDGRSAIITNSDGSKSQVLLGYDRAGSLAIDAANMQRQKTQGDITHTAAETALVNAKVDEYGKPDAANTKFQVTTIVDPKNPTQMIAINGPEYKGGTVGDPGVIGVSGKEPTAALREEKKDEGREGLKLDIQSMRDNYQKLDDLKAIPNVDRGTWDNLQSSVQASDAGQWLGQKFGTKEQEIRNDIDASKRRILSSIKAMTNAGSREFGTNYEMKLWMDSIGSTQRPVGGDLDILNEFEKKYITGPESRKAAAAANKQANYASSNTNGSPAPNVTDPSNPSSNMPPPLIRSADTSTSIRNAQAAINSGKWTRAQAIEKLRSAGIMDTP